MDTSSGSTTVGTSGSLSVAAGGVTVNTGGINVGSSGATIAGTMTVTAGTMSVTSSTTGTDIVDVLASSATLSGTVITGRVQKGSQAATALQASEGSNSLFTVLTNGYVSATGSAGLTVGAGVTAAAGLLVSSGGTTLTAGNLLVNSGAVSVSATSGSTTLDVTASASGYTGALIQGRLKAGSTSNALSLTEGSNLLFQVR